MQPFHRKAHDLAGKETRLVKWIFAPNIPDSLADAAVRVIDWFDRVNSGKTWLEGGSSKESDEAVRKMCVDYHDRVMAAIGSKRHWPIDDHVVVVEILGSGQQIVAHTQELIVPES